MTDRRLTPANGRVAHVALRGAVAAERFVEGVAASIAVPVADLLAAPAGRRDRQLLMGDMVTVLETCDGFAFLRSEKDGYCGYVAAHALGPARTATHWVAAPATHLYPAPNLKAKESARVSLGARLTLKPGEGPFLEMGDGRFVPAVHMKPVSEKAADPAALAESLLGTPYLWGGNSSDGIDCSGLVQVALLSAGHACPGDSDLQEAALGSPVPSGAPYRRNDLFFWKGHVAIALDANLLIHANAFRMAVSREGIADCIARIDAGGEGPLRVVKRL